MIRSRIEKLIVQFENKCKGPQQGSNEWLALRVAGGGRSRGRIGGSEVAILLGVNPWTKIKDLMLQKQGKKKNVVDNIMVHMGSLLEEVTVKVFEQKFNTKTYAKNVSIIDPSNLNQFIFSPDGIAILPRVNDNVSLTPIDDNSKCCPVLLEIKNPWSRAITKDGKVPPAYMAQIQAGLIAIPLAHSGIFIDSATKLCSYKQLFSDGFNNVLHAQYVPPARDEHISTGVILLTGKLPLGFWKKDCNVVEIGRKRIYDLGDCGYKNTHAIVKACKGGGLSADYFRLCDEMPDKYLDELIKDIDSKEVLGIICYKVFDISYTVCYRDQNMIKNIRSELNKYSQGELDVDEDYVPKKRKRSPSARGVPNISFDTDSSDDES